MKKPIYDLLKSLEKTRSQFWNISPETGFFLNEIIRSFNYKTALEIGTSNGYSGIWLAEALAQNNGHLYTVESHMKERFYLAKENFEKAGLSKHITQIAGHAPEVVPPSPRKFDLVFLDATKYEHPDYFEALGGRVKKGGMIITDNLFSHEKELAPYRKIVEKQKDWSSYALDIGTGLLVSIKL